VPAGAGTFPTDRPLFTALLIRHSILIVGALTFFPALALGGPILEQLQLHAGILSHP